MPRGPDSLEAGALIAGRYRLERKLGQGATGVVWQAIHRKTGKSAALKFLKLPGPDPVAARTRFLQEARAVLDVHHPSIAPMHDILELDEQALCLVLDVLQGETLAARLARQPILPLPEVASLLVHVCSALGTAHAAGLVHRDLTPDHIFLVTEPKDRAPVQILGFAMQKRPPPGPETTAADAETAQGPGTKLPFYLAPEQFFGDKTLDHRADLWALGVLLYEALAGVRPTEANTVGKIMKMQMQGGIVPLRERMPELPAPVLDLVARLLKTDRKERPADMREVVAALAPYATEAAPAFEAARPSRFSSPRRPRLSIPADGATNFAEEDVFGPTLAAANTTLTGDRPASAPDARGTGSRARAMKLAAVGLLVILAAAWAGMRGMGAP